MRDVILSFCHTQYFPGEVRQGGPTFRPPLRRALCPARQWLDRALTTQAALREPGSLGAQVLVQTCDPSPPPRPCRKENSPGEERVSAGGNVCRGPPAPWPSLWLPAAAAWPNQEPSQVCVLTAGQVQAARRPPFPWPSEPSAPRARLGQCR